MTTTTLRSGRHRLPHHLSEDLKSVHASTGLSLHEAAFRIGISRSFLWKLLAAKAAPSTRTAERIIATYELSAPLATELRDAAVPRVEHHPTRNTLPADVAAMLKAAREQSGFTFREAAQRMGISPGFLCEMCQGRAAPSRAVAERIIEVLELDEAVACDLLEAAV